MDEDVGASWSYDEGRRVMVSYDTKEMSKRKVDFIKNHGLGGAMWWESSADRQGNESLISTVLRNVRYLATLLIRTRLFMGCILWIEPTIYSSIQTPCTTILGMGFLTSNRYLVIRRHETRDRIEKSWTSRLQYRTIVIC